MSEVTTKINLKGKVRKVRNLFTSFAWRTRLEEVSNLKSVRCPCLALQPKLLRANGHPKMSVLPSAQWSPQECVTLARLSVRVVFINTNYNMFGLDCKAHSSPARSRNPRNEPPPPGGGVLLGSFLTPMRPTSPHGSYKVDTPEYRTLWSCLPWCGTCQLVSHKETPWSTPAGSNAGFSVSCVARRHVPPAQLVHQSWAFFAPETPQMRTQWKSWRWHAQPPIRPWLLLCSLAQHQQPPNQSLQLPEPVLANLNQPSVQGPMQLQWICPILRCPDRNVSAWSTEERRKADQEVVLTHLGYTSSTLLTYPPYGQLISGLS